MAPFMNDGTPSPEGLRSGEKSHFNAANLNEPQGNNPKHVADPIAICGMAVRLPGDIMSSSQFWDFLISKGDARCKVPESRYNISGHYSKTGKPGFVKNEYGYFLSENVDLGALDTTFFTMPKTELERCDPHQRQLLEVVGDCFRNAGEVNTRGKSIGCFIGAFGEDWAERFFKDSQDYGLYKISGYGDFTLSNRISYEYDLKGPSMTLKTGCSSALIGLHEACLAIERGECSGAIVGGVNLILAPGMTVAMYEQGILSPTGSCKSFSADADGYARGEAINSIYIKRLSDAIIDGNPIRGVIRGTSSNCDGKTVGMTLPSSETHEAMIRKAYQVAGIEDLSQTAYVECHGTGTQIGDPIEVAAVANVFGDNGVYIGSVKPNVGHSEGASGITSLIKGVLALENQIIPPNIRFTTPNPKIPFREKKLTVPVEPTPWPQDRCERVSVNSFGIGGANAHVIIDSARSFFGLKETKPSSSSSAQLLVFSANTNDSLRKQVVSTQQYLEQRPEVLDSLAFTLSARRDHLLHRAFSVCGQNCSPNTSSFVRSPTSVPELVMIFTGQGAQWPGMGAELIQNNQVFQESIKAMDNVLKKLEWAPEWSIEKELLKSGESSNLSKAAFSQPLCTAVQIALVDALTSIKVRPYAVIGHSSGEMAAAYAAGKLTRQEAIMAAYYRGVVSGYTGQPGGMAAIGTYFLFWNPLRLAIC
jgi:acyl transferase domain-containing protein